MIHAFIFLVVGAVALYFIVKHSPKAEAEAQVIEADVKADATKVEADVKKL